MTPIKRGTAFRLGLGPPRGPMLGVPTAANTVLLPEEYRQIEDRFARSLKGNWQFIYATEDVEDRASRFRGRSWWWMSERRPR